MQAIKQRQHKQINAELMKLRPIDLPVIVSSKTVHFATTVAGSDAASGFMNPMPSKVELRAQYAIDLQPACLNDTND